MFSRKKKQAAASAAAASNGAGAAGPKKKNMSPATGSSISSINVPPIKRRFSEEDKEEKRWRRWLGLTQRGFRNQLSHGMQIIEGGSDAESSLDL
jgi:hypothetical protein